MFNKTRLLAAAAVFPLLIGSAAATAQSMKSNGTSTYSGTLTALNGSGVTGSFTIEQRGQGQIRVNIQATGLEPTSQPHLGHIHGFEGSKDAMCPTTAQDTDRDGFVELAEGLPTYGPIILNFGDVDPDHDGTVNYSKTFNLNKDSAFAAGKGKGSILPLELREIVLHGLTLRAGQGSNGGEADGTAGYKTVLPIACGKIMKSGG